MRFVVAFLVAEMYCWLVASANAQDFDPPINIGNQVDDNVSRALQTQTVNGSFPALAVSSTGASAQAIKMGYEDYSGFLVPAPPGSPAKPVNWVEPNVWVVREQDLATDVQPTPSQTIEVTESNVLLHDTNQEPLTPPAASIPYQNWAKFGLAVAYRNKEVDPPGSKNSGFRLDSVKIEYKPLTRCTRDTMWLPALTLSSECLVESMHEIRGGSNYVL